MTEATVRGQADGPLTPKGRGEARQIGEDFARKGGLSCLYLSTAKRAKETADYLVKANPSTDLETPSHDILSWSLGDLEGEPTVEAQPKLAAFIKYLPDVAPPGKSPLSGKRGESFDDFRWRALPYIGKQMAEWNANKKLKLGILTHHRVVRLLMAWVKGGLSPFMDVDTADMSREYEAGRPGSVWCFRPTGTGRLWSMTPVNMASEGKLEPAVYIVRHCSTRLNAGSDTGLHASHS